jgi:FHA domain
MGDPRLNSMHLDPDRRQEFRRARDEVLHNRGNETLHAELGLSTDESCNTYIHHENGATPPTDLTIWLTDPKYTYPLKVGINTLGRSSDNDVVVEELFISRRHFVIVVHQSGSCMLHDMSSKNGTYLNGTRVSHPTQLRPGDEIRICNHPFVFRTRAGNGAADPPTING